MLDRMIKFILENGRCSRIFEDRNLTHSLNLYMQMESISMCASNSLWSF